MNACNHSQRCPFNHRLVLLCLSSFCAASTGLQAATITVTTTDDSGAGSLREALARVTDGDTIDFAVTGAITLASGELVVTNSVDITGACPTDLAVSGNGASRVFRVGPGVVVTISGLTIRNGATSGAYPGDRGGGIFNDHSTLKVSNCIVSGNSASQDGGGIYNNAFGGSATLQIIDSTLNGNSALNGNGGGIASNGELGRATLQIASCVIGGNSAGNLGGGVLNQGDSGIANLLIDSTWLTGNTGSGGGGIGNMGGTLTVSSSAISGNSALNGDGGGIANFGQLQSSTSAQIANSTLSGNSATNGSGGGVVNVGLPRASASVRILYTTLSGNSAGGSHGGGGGIANSSLFGGSAMVDIGNTILNAGTAGENISNTSGAVISLGYNLSSDAGGGFLTATGDQINTDPMLGPLQDNGGPTLTHALPAKSPAINTGDPNFIPPPDFDQRGLGFPRVVGGRIDIGAFEAAEPMPPVITQIRDLIALVRSMRIDEGIEHALITTLREALNAAKADKHFKTCSAMRAFIALVRAQAGNKLTSAQATRLISDANQIRATLACQ
jgi:hypothetical protein